MEKNKWIQEGRSLFNGERTIRIGDYVKYEASGTKYKGKWIAIGVSKEGYLMIMAANNVSNVTISGKQGYTEGTVKINEVCSKYGYGRGAVYARSVAIEDINKLATVFKAKIKQFTEQVDYYWDGSLLPVRKAKEQENRLMGEHKKFIWYDEKAKKWCESENKFKSEKIVTIASNCYLYSIFGRRHNRIDESFWLATSFADSANSSIVCWGIQHIHQHVHRQTVVSYSYLVESDGTEYKETMGVRPIVFLDTGDEIKSTEWEF